MGGGEREGDGEKTRKKECFGERRVETKREWRVDGGLKGTETIPLHALWR